MIGQIISVKTIRLVLSMFAKRPCSARSMRRTMRNYQVTPFLKNVIGLHAYIRYQIIINTWLFVYQYLENGIQFCPRYFDGWSCINGTKAGEEATFDCPPSNQKSCPFFVERKLQNCMECLVYQGYYIRENADVEV